MGAEAVREKSEIHDIILTALTNLFEVEKWISEGGGEGSLRPAESLLSREATVDLGTTVTRWTGE